MQRTGQTLPRQTPRRPSHVPEHPYLNGRWNTKPIPRWDVHFGVLKMTERTPQPLVSPLGPNWVGTDSAV